MRSRILTAAFLAAALSAIAAAQSHPVYARNGIVASAEAHATDAGVEIMRAGGNAYDAAVAVGFALAVTYPQAGNLGGGGFFVALDARGNTYALDFREKAPAAAHRDMFLDAQGNVVPGRSTDTHLAAGVPGTPDGLLQIHERFGKLPRRRVLDPAIRLARNGFPVSQALSSSLASNQKRLARFPGSAASFYPGGKPPEFGQILRQRDLADTLERIARQGRDGFYRGRTADLIVAEMKRGNGLISHKDLENYRSQWREPFIFRAGEFELITHPVPSSGGFTLAQILGLVDLDKLKAAGRNSAQYIHMLTEAQRLAYADRNYHLGDPDFVDVPVEKLTSAAYLAERRRLIPEGKAGVSEKIGPGREEKLETTHYTVADREGNVVAITYTINGGYGMGAVVQGAGFLLNNEMDDFTSKPGVPNMFGLVQSSANAIEPGKRMLSSMTPTIVRRNGEFWMTAGSPGGSTIITTVLQVFLNMALFDMNIRDAIDAGRFHHQWLPDEVVHERLALSPDTLALLEKMGYPLRQTNALGFAAGIQRARNDLYAGWSDKRGDGKTAGF
jgi:gamma-glutamyltranspeptidase / glutathione hydrolase